MKNLSKAQKEILGLLSQEGAYIDNRVLAAFVFTPQRYLGKVGQATLNVLRKQKYVEDVSGWGRKYIISNLGREAIK